jgi:hypothetical protein
MNQKEAVFQAIKEIKPHDVDQDRPVVLSKQEKQIAHQKLFDGFKKGKIAYNHEMPSDDKLDLYISGLVSNWLRKDKRLNGHSNYAPRRPGSRSPSVVQDYNGMDEQQMEALRALTNSSPNEPIQVFVIKRPNFSKREDETENASQ